MEMYTENLAEFGYREQDIAQDIFVAWKKSGLPEDFYNDGVKIAMNKSSGYVFLTNADYQVAMLEDGELVSFYYSPYEGIEGTFEDLKMEYEYMHPEDKRWYIELANNLNKSIL